MTTMGRHEGSSTWETFWARDGFDTPVWRRDRLVGNRWVLVVFFVGVFGAGLWLLFVDPSGHMNEGGRRDWPNWVLGVMITPCSLIALWCFFQQLRFERRPK